MEEQSVTPVSEEKEISADERLKALADKNGLSVDELLNDLEEKQAVLDEHSAINHQSVGSQSKNAQDFFDPAGDEFLKGLWGR